MIQQQPNGSRPNILSLDILEQIQELTSVGADEFVRTEEGGTGLTRKEVQEYFTSYLKEHVSQILLQQRALQNLASFTKLVDAGCEPARLAYHLYRCKGAPIRVTPAWEDLLPTIPRRGLDAHINNLASLALEVQEFISERGLDLAPGELVVGLEKLPELLLRFSEILLYAHCATDKRGAVGPGGLDALAVLELAIYVQSCTGRTYASDLADLLTQVRVRDKDDKKHGNAVDERVYARFVKKYLR